MKTHVDAADARPAGKAGECFYCHRNIGEEHTWECVIPEKRVRLRVTLEYETGVPRSWTPYEIESRRNDQCIGNCAQEIQAFIDEKPGECNICQTASVQLVRLVDWETPTIKPEFLCSNCDGAPDGGHTGDIWCIHYEDK